MSTKPLLTLSTAVPERLHIDIDSRRYDMIARADLTLREEIRLQRMLRDRMMTMDPQNFTATEDDAEEMMARLREFVQRILPDAPATVLDALNDDQRFSIFTVFLGQAKAATPTAEEPEPVEEPAPVQEPEAPGEPPISAISTSANSSQP